MRLDQFVSQATGLSRSEAQRMIRGGRVCVADEVWVKPAAHIDPQAPMTLDGQSICLAGAVYLMFHKPVGVVSATMDASQRTVMAMINHPHLHTLHIVGRLDKDTTGLLLLTNDGNWSHRVSSPKHHVPKTYLATLAEPLTARAAEQLQAGVLLHGEKQLVYASDVQVLTNQQVRLTIHEGKYHQVKRMFAAVQNEVTALHRERIGGLSLDPALALGEWRALSASEVEGVFERTD